MGERDRKKRRKKKKITNVSVYTMQTGNEMEMGNTRI